MKIIAKWTLLTLFGLAGVLVLAAVSIFAISEVILQQRRPFTPAPLALTQAGPNATSGASIVRTFGCDGCHGTDLRGLTIVDIPMVVRIRSPNLTLVAKGYSDAQLAEIVRSGERPDGRGLIIMPSDAASRLSDQEIGSVISYIRSKPAGGVMGEGVQLGLIGRIAFLMGQFKPAPQLVATARAKPLPDFGPATSEGRAIARACVECHGPDLSGNIGPDLRIAIAYDLPAFAHLLRTGIGLDGKLVRPTGIFGEDKTVGLMAEVAPQRFGSLSDAEIAGLHGYLKARLDHLKR